MMLRIAVFLLAAMAASGAEDSWAKVRQIKSGAELRVYKKGATQPLVAKMDEASDESLIVVFKNKQVAIAKDQIDRVDARPLQSVSRVTKEKKETVEVDPRAKPPGPFEGPGPSGPTTTTSTSSGLSFHPRPNFETIFRREAAGTEKR